MSGHGDGRTEIEIRTRDLKTGVDRSCSIVLRMSKVFRHVRNESLSMENDCRTNTEGFFHTIS